MLHRRALDRPAEAQPNNRRHIWLTDVYSAYVTVKAFHHRLHTHLVSELVSFKSELVYP